MKRFHVYAGEDYYPLAGLGDYRNSFKELNDALTFAREFHKKPGAASTNQVHACVIESTDDGLKYRYVKGVPYGEWFNFWEVDKEIMFNDCIIED